MVSVRRFGVRFGLRAAFLMALDTPVVESLDSEQILRLFLFVALGSILACMLHPPRV